MTQSKNLLLIGSQYSEFQKQELIDTAQDLGMKIIPADIGSFKSGERFCELYPNQKELFLQNQEDIAGATVHIVMNMQDDPSKFFVDTINVAETVKEYGAASVHMVLAFSPFARQDRAFEDRMVSIMGKTFPKHLRAAGVDRISTIDMHSVASEQFFKNYFNHEPQDDNVHLFSAAEEIYKTVCLIKNKEDLMIGGPDGANKPHDVAQRKVDSMITFAYGADQISKRKFGIEKGHIDANTTIVKNFYGNVKGKTVLELDDMTDTGGTLINGATTLKEKEAEECIAAVTHIFSENSLEALTSEKINGKANPIDLLIATDSILSIRENLATLPEENKKRVLVVSTMPIIKQALILAA